jgi:putative endonuclease
MYREALLTKKFSILHKTFLWLILVQLELTAIVFQNIFYFSIMKQSYVYILKCSDKTYYTGVTSNLTQRIFQHESGFYPDCYTFKKRPVELVFYCEFTDINIAIEKEEQIKKWSQAKKEALINDDYDSLPNLAKKKFKL